MKTTDSRSFEIEDFGTARGWARPSSARAWGSSWASSWGGATAIDLLPSSPSSLLFPSSPSSSSFPSKMKMIFVAKSTTSERSEIHDLGAVGFVFGGCVRPLILRIVMGVPFRRGVAGGRVGESRGFVVIEIA